MDKTSTRVTNADFFNIGNFVSFEYRLVFDGVLHLQTFLPDCNEFLHLNY